MKEIQLGVKARDKITGFEGIVVSKVVYLTGCDQYGLTPSVCKEGKPADTQYFDVSRLAVTGEGVTKDADLVQARDRVTSDPTGGPNRDAPSR